MNPLLIFNALSNWIVPALILLALLYGYLRGVKVFETFVEGAKEGFDMAVRLIPFLVGMMVAIGLFRGSGALELLTLVLTPVLRLSGIPAEVLPLGLMRPLSGNGALAIAVEMMNTFGPDSLLGRMAATMQGSTDTTLFVLTVYFGTVGIRKTRYALITGLLGDLAGLLAAIFICRMVFH
ncbi:MAG: spore maturation protein [Firmicutes bacterium]|nr:spore maturation protein [Bacillota bacterium]